MFEIIIKEKRKMEVPGVQIFQMTKKEVEEAFGFYDPDKKHMKSVYGYTPKIIKTEIVEQELLRQNVEDLDLKAVICAINGLKE